MLASPDLLSAPSPERHAADRPCAADVTRGTVRLLARHDLAAMCEVSLDGNRRADLMALDPRGQIVIVEVKVSRADLLGDGKWPEYLGCCDRFYWAVPPGLDPTLLDRDAFLPERTGIIVADRYNAVIVREAQAVCVSAATRKRVTLAFARRAARRVTALLDPDIEIPS